MTKHLNKGINKLTFPKALLLDVFLTAMTKRPPRWDIVIWLIGRYMCRYIYYVLLFFLHFFFYFLRVCVILSIEARWVERVPLRWCPQLLVALVGPGVEACGVQDGDFLLEGHFRRMCYGRLLSMGSILDLDFLVEG